MKVLFVSENKHDWELLRRMMKNLYKEVEFMCAINQADAINIVSSDGPFGIFLIDAEMKNTDPDSLVNMLIDFSGDRPCLFLGKDSIIIDKISQKTYQSNEYNEKLLKPLDREDIIDDLKVKIAGALRWAKEEEFEAAIEEVNPDDFISMKIKSFYLYNIFPHDIYLSITSTQYIKIISANKNYTLSTLNIYTKKNIKHLYIKKNDQLKFLEHESIKCLKALSKPNIKTEDLYIISLKSITVLHLIMRSLGVTSAVLKLTESITDALISMCNTSRPLKDILESYPSSYHGTASKSLLTCIIANKLCKQMGWDSTTTKKKLAVSSIIQDYILPDDGLSKINFLSDPRLQNYTEEEMRIFINHPKTVADISRQFTMYPDIDYILEHHHELPLRTGFPAQPPQTKLISICGVFNTAQYFASEIDGHKITNGLSRKILKAMNTNFSIGNFKEPYSFLMNLLLNS